MHLELTDEQRALEAEVRAFLADRQAHPDTGGDWLAGLQARGWSAPGWPRPWGGGFEPAQAYIVERTLALAGCPTLDHSTLHQVGPLLLMLADEALCHRFLPSMARGQIRWVLHGSVLGAPPLERTDLMAGFRPEARQVLAYEARSATTLAVAAVRETETLLAVAELTPGTVSSNQPLDPDTVNLEALEFEVLATTNSHQRLAAALASLAEPGVPAWGCRTGSLRYRIEGLRELTPDPDLAALGVALAGLEAMEQRAVFAADPALMRAVSIHTTELGRALAERLVQQLGYYALPAAEQHRQHNELPEQALAAQDAMAELIRYLEGDFGLQRDHLARELGIS